MIKNIFFIFFLFSLGAHIIFFSNTSFEIDSKKRPVIKAWTGILQKDQLRAQPKIKEIPKEINLSIDRIRKSYFSKPLPLAAHSYVFDHAIKPQKYQRLAKSKKEDTDYLFFLWKKKPCRQIHQKSVTYQALVSPYGKIILHYPKKLTPNPELNVADYTYVRESTYSLKKDFFWTKFDILVE